jgi:heme exporter protein B
VSFVRRAFIVVWKDLKTERRSKEGLNALVFFSLLLLFVFQFALGQDRERFTAALPGLLWLGFILSGLIGVGRTLQIERENDCWEALVLTPGDKSSLYLGKLLGTLLLMLTIEALLLALFAVFFNLDVVPALPALSVVIVLGTTGFAAAGTLFAAMTAHVRARELLLPVLLLPVQLPVLLGTVEATAEILRGQPLAAVISWLTLIAAADVIYVTLGILTFEYVLES